MMFRSLATTEQSRALAKGRRRDFELTLRRPSFCSHCESGISANTLMSAGQPRLQTRLHLRRLALI